MQINRTNYEHFFLLYVDGELSTSEMQAVERFAVENSDLAAELDALLETKLDADTDAVFVDKEILFRTASNSINEINYEEQFLLFLDGELTEKEKEQTLVFLDAHPNLHASFELLEQTKLPLETISFGDKTVLYQKESRRPVAMGWWRMAVAAALIGLMVLGWNLYPSGKQLDPLVKTDQKVVLPSQTNDVKAISSHPGENRTILANNGNPVPNNANNHSSEGQALATKNNESAVLANNEAMTNVAGTEAAGLEEPTTSIAANANQPSQTVLENADHANQLGHATATPDGSNDAGMVHPTVYKELDTDDENKSLYVGNLELNRDKLRGFFRKAGNLFKSKIKSEDDRNENANPRSLK